LVPGADPAGRAVLNEPPAYTVLPITTCDQTTPLTCTVGSASALTPEAGTGMTGAGAAVAEAIAPTSAAAHSDTTATALVTDLRTLLRDMVHPTTTGDG
jgi:hypothetical protein